MPVSTGDRRRILAGIQLAALVAVMALHFGGAGHPRVETGSLTVKLLLFGKWAAVLALASWFLRIRGLSWAGLGLRRPSWRRFALAIPLGLVGGFMLVTVVQAGLRMARIAPSNFSAFAGVHGNLGEYLFWGFAVAWIAAAAGEELLFRGFAMDALQRIAGRGTRGATAVAIVGQAILFGALHLYQGLGGAITTGVIGLVLGLVWLGSGRNLWAGMLMHGLIDCGSMTAIYLNGVPS